MSDTQLGVAKEEVDSTRRFVHWIAFALWSAHYPGTIQGSAGVVFAFYQRLSVFDGLELASYIDLRWELLCHC